MVKTAAIALNGVMLLIMASAIFSAEASMLEFAILGCIMVFPLLSIIGLSKSEEGFGSWRGQWSERSGKNRGS